MNAQQQYLHSGSGCPKCGEEGYAESYGVEHETTAIYQNCQCTECHAVWTNSYHLSALLIDGGIIEIEEL